MKSMPIGANLISVETQELEEIVVDDIEMKWTGIEYLQEGFRRLFRGPDLRGD